MWEVKSLTELEEAGVLKLGRGKIISKKDLAALPGDFPVYSSSKVGDGKFGEYGLYMFEEELITWSIDGGGRIFHREKHKFSITNVTGFLRILDASVFSYKYLYYALSLLHSKINFDWVKKAHPSVLRKEYKHIPVPPLAEQERIVAKLDAAFAEIDEAIEAAEDINQNVGAIFEKILDTSTQQQAPSVKLRDVCDIHAKLISPKDEPYCSESHIGAGNIVSMSNELVNVLLAKEEGLISGKFPFGTDSVLYSKIRPYLRKVHLPSHTGICSADIYPLVPNAKILDRKYLYYLLLSQNFTDYAMSGAARAGMPKVNRNHLFNFEFQLPALEVQRLIVKKMEAIRLESSNIQRIQNLKITQSKALKSAILAQELQSSEAA